MYPREMSKQGGRAGKAPASTRSRTKKNAKQDTWKCVVCNSDFDDEEDHLVECDKM